MKTIEKNGMPNQSTKGEVGDIYIDTSTGFKYKCESIIKIGDDGELKTYYNWYGIMEDYKKQADVYKQKLDNYESVLTGEVTEFAIPENWTKLRICLFRDCQSLTNVILHDNVTHISFGCFFTCTSLTNITIPSNVVLIGDNAFNTCRSLKTINLPSSIKQIFRTSFINCASLENVTLGDNFNCNSLDLSASTKYSVDTLIAMLTALADRTGQTAYTLTLGATNLAKLSDEQKAIATDKNWTLA